MHAREGIIVGRAIGRRAACRVLLCLLTLVLEPDLHRAFGHVKQRGQLQSRVAGGKPRLFKNL